MQPSKEQGPQMIKTIEKLFNYHEWAMNAIFSSLQNFTEEEFTRDLGDGCGSVRDKVGHIIAADKIWLDRIQKRAELIFLPPSYFSSISITKNLKEETKTNWKSYIASLQVADYYRDISYQNMKGESFETPLREILLHVLNHATYHRGQVASLIRRIKGSPPVTDFIQFARNPN